MYIYTYIIYIYIYIYIYKYIYIDKKNLMLFVLDALFTISIVGYLDHLSMHAKKFCFFLFSLRMGSPKSICNSSIGSEQLSSGNYLLCGITGFSYLPISE